MKKRRIDKPRTWVLLTALVLLPFYFLALGHEYLFLFLDEAEGHHDHSRCPLCRLFDTAITLAVAVFLLVFFSEPQPFAPGGADIRLRFPAFLQPYRRGPPHPLSR